MALSPCSRFFVALFLAAWFVGIGPAPAAHAATDFAGNQADFLRAVAALKAKVGGDARLLSLTVEPDDVTLVYQGPGGGHRLLEVRYGWRNRLFRMEMLSSPRPTRDRGIVPDVTAGFFGFDEMNVDAVAGLRAQAVERAEMQDRASIAALTLERTIQLLPTPGYGPLRWTVSLRTDYEQASITATPQGTVLGADLSGTIRARTLNLHRDSWAYAQATRDIAAVFGGKPVLVEFRIYPSYIFLVTRHPTDRMTLRSFSWDLGGVKGSGPDSPAFPDKDNAGPPTFSPDAVTLEGLPGIIEAGRAAIGAPDAAVTLIEADIVTDRPGGPQLLWEVRYKEDSGEESVVLATMAGVVVETRLPKSRQPAVAWLEPSGILATLARIEKELGSDVEFHEIMFRDDRADVTIVDPKAPDGQRSLLVYADSIRESPMSMGPMLGFVGPQPPFGFKDLKVLDEARLTAYLDQTIRTMNLPGGAVSRVTLSRGVVEASPRGVVIVEIRYDKGMAGGRMTFESDSGKAIETMTP